MAGVMMAEEGIVMIPNGELEQRAILGTSKATGLDVLPILCSFYTSTSATINKLLFGYLHRVLFTSGFGLVTLAHNTARIFMSAYISKRYTLSISRSAFDLIF